MRILRSRIPLLLRAKSAPIFVYSLMMVIWFWPFIFANQIVAPQLPYRGGMQPTSLSFWDQVTAKPAIYGDFPNQEIGEIFLSHTSPKSGHLAIWTNQSGQGRALFPHYAYTESTFTTWLATRIGGDLFGGDIYHIVTLRNISLIYVAGLFLMLYGLQLNLHRWASLLAGFIYATSPPFSAWIVNYPFMVSGSIGIMAIYAIHRLIVAPRFIFWLLLAWAIHIEITSAYLQHVVYIFYLLAGYTLYLALSHTSHRAQRIQRITLVASACIVGCSTSIPMIIDLYREYQFSIRSFAQNTQANIIPISDAYKMTSLVLPELFNVKPQFSIPIDQDFQLLNGRYFTWLTSLLILVGSICATRKVWGWLIWLAVAFAMSYIPFIHDIVFNSVFPQISPWSKPFDFATLHVPSAIIMMWGLHHLITNPWRYTWIIGIIGSIIIFIAIWSGYTIGAQPRWLFVIFEICITTAIIIRSWWHSPRYLFVIAGASIITSALVTFPTIYRQLHTDMYTTSQIHEIIKNNLDTGQTLVEVSSPDAQICCFVRGNENIMFQIPTVHVYRSNISIYYANLVKRLGGTIVRGNTSNFIQPRYNLMDFWMLNVGVVISYQPQKNPNLTLITQRDQLYIYRNNAVGASCCFAVPYTAIQNPIKPNKYGHLALNIGNIRKQTYEHILKISDRGDTYQLTNPYQHAAIIIMNHVFHPSWHAFSIQDNRVIALETVVINQVYQGVIVPEGVTHITLEFTPWSRWMWVIHWAWILSFGLVIALSIYHRTKNRGDALGITPP